MKVCRPSIISSNIMPKIDNDDCFIEDNYTHYSDTEELLAEQKETLKNFFDNLFKEKERYYQSLVNQLETRVGDLESQLEYYKSKLLNQKPFKLTSIKISRAHSAGVEKPEGKKTTLKP